MAFGIKHYSEYYTCISSCWPIYLTVTPIPVSRPVSEDILMLYFQPLKLIWLKAIPHKKPLEDITVSQNGFLFAWHFHLRVICYVLLYGKNCCLIFTIFYAKLNTVFEKHEFTVTSLLKFYSSRSGLLTMMHFENMHFDGGLFSFLHAQK